VRDIVLNVVSQIDTAFKTTFETLECTSIVEFGMLKNKFTDKVPEKNKKVKTVKYEEINITEHKERISKEVSPVFVSNLLH